MLEDVYCLVLKCVFAVVMEVDGLETKTLAHQESEMMIENKSKAESDEDDGKLVKKNMIRTVSGFEDYSKRV